MFISRRRKEALVGAVVAWGASAWWFSRLLEQPPAQWNGSTLLAAALLSAIGSAVIWMEVLRAMVSRMARWSDPIHFNWTGVLAFALFVVQYIGLRLMMSSAA